MTQAIDALAKWRHNIYLVSQMIQNDVSSTKVRLLLRRGMSVRYLTPNSVMEYIDDFELYRDEGPNNSNSNYQKQLYRERERERENSSEKEKQSSSSSTSR